jgi:hypothetical protein
MNAVRYAPAIALLALVACTNAAPSADTPAVGAGQMVSDPVVPLECTPSERMPVAGRASPYDSATIAVGDQQIKVCYGRPAAREREIFGGLVPYDRLWRTGANEPTIVHVPFAAEIAGIRVEPGSYSLYTVPGRDSWSVVINRSISQWGHESSYTAEIEAQEVGRATVPSERLDQHVESFTVRGEPTGAGADLLLEWERTRVRVTVRAVAAAG